VHDHQHLKKAGAFQCFFSLDFIPCAMPIGESVGEAIVGANQKTMAMTKP
jgi:hypothetical protein